MRPRSESTTQHTRQGGNVCQTCNVCVVCVPHLNESNDVRKFRRMRTHVCRRGFCEGELQRSQDDRTPLSAYSPGRNARHRTPPGNWVRRGIWRRRPRGFRPEAHDGGEGGRRSLKTQRSSCPLDSGSDRVCRVPCLARTLPSVRSRGLLSQLGTRAAVNVLGSRGGAATATSLDFVSHQAESFSS